MGLINTVLANFQSVFIAGFIVLALLICLITFFIISKFFNLWLQSKIAEAEVPFPELFGMWFRKANARLIVQSYITAKKAGLDVSVQQVEVHNLAGGDLDHVTKALIAAKRSGVELSWDAACAIDLSGRDIFDTLNDPEANLA